MERAYQRFLPLNRTLIVACHDWQVLPSGAPNDHRDARYDWAVVDRVRAWLGLYAEKPPTDRHEKPKARRLEPYRPFPVEALPADWRTYPAPEKLRDLGTGWVRSGRTAVLLVPSSVIPHEMNVLLNPAHPDFAKIHIREAEPFSYDPRMWK